ncbi:PspC domain-containing protein [Arthrobacter sp. UYP6]|uniref:PspC domain-containing protein n=1 Tax=Arthrobacter sp. UYP6 TaxID=1756378 RepID=UPI003398DBC2
MTPHPTDPGPADDRQPPAGSPAEPLPPYNAGENPTRPLPPYTAAGSHRVPEADPASGAGPRPNGFFTWLRSLGIIRGQDRWLGGVCSGIAARTGMDPVLVRGLIVVLGLFGGGLLLYGLAWALLPEPDGRIHAEEALRGSWSSGTTGALVACILGAGSPSIFWSGDGLLGGFFWTLFWVVGLGLLVYWLFTRSGRGGTPRTAEPDAYPSAHQESSYPAPQRGYAAAQTGYAPPPNPYPTSDSSASSSSSPGSFGSAAPGTAGPRGTAPANTGPRQPRTSPAAAEVAVVLGAALLVLGTILTLDYAGIIALETPAAVALAAAAVANGLGIVVLGALGRSSGVLGLTAVAALVAAGVAGTNLGTYATVVVANQADWRPTASQPATDGYTLAAVDGQLDLRYLSDEADFAVEVPVSVAASDLTILVPDDIPVVVRADMFAGNVQIDDGATLTEDGGFWRSSDERLNDPNGEPLVLRIKGFASNVLVTVNESDLNR